MAYKFFGGKRYYPYESYDSRYKAMKAVKSFQKQNNKVKYKIEVEEVGFWFPEKKYKLYLDKVFQIGGLTVICRTRGEALKCSTNAMAAKRLL